jgi:hypothetical protein
MNTTCRVQSCAVQALPVAVVLIARAYVLGVRVLDLYSRMMRESCRWFAVECVEEMLGGSALVHDGMMQNEVTA